MNWCDNAMHGYWKKVYVNKHIWLQECWQEKLCRISSNCIWSYSWMLSSKHWIDIPFLNVSILRLHRIIEAPFEFLFSIIFILNFNVVNKMLNDRKWMHFVYLYNQCLPFWTVSTMHHTSTPTSATNFDIF